MVTRNPGESTGWLKLVGSSWLARAGWLELARYRLWYTVVGRVGLQGSFCPMRILLLTHGLPPESVGGVEQHVSGLAGALCAAGREVAIFARSSREGAQGSLLPEESVAGCAVTRAIYRWEGLRSLRDLYRCTVMEEALSRYLSGREFDVAHVHHMTGLSTGAVAVLQAAGIPTVVTLHDYWIMCPRGQMWHKDEHPCEQVEKDQCAACLAPMFGAWLQPGVGPGSGPAKVKEIHDLARQTLGSADRLLTPSARTIPFFARLGLDPHSIGVVENGVDTTGLAGVPPVLEVPAGAAGAAGPLRIGYLGTLIPSKGLDVLVDAFLRLPQGVATLTVHGNAVPYHGDDGFLTRVFGRLPPGAHVRYHGPYGTGDLPELLAGIDLLVAPALWHEAFGLTVREAQAAGRAVVVSRIGGLQDAVEHGVEGLLVEPGDVGGLTDALAELAADPHRVAAMGAAARRRARGFAAMADELVRVYEDVQEERGSRKA